MKFSDLNSQQYKAVQIFDRPLIINAGPGTGKTKALISKVQFALENKIFSPQDIIVLTFTEKTGREIQERLDDRKIGFAGTFHAFCFNLLNQNCELKLVPADIRNEIIESLNSKLKLRDTELAISRFKNKLSTENSELVHAYNSKLNEFGFVDFDDLLLMTIEKLEKSQFQNFKYILVDEFQDTNLIQYEILKFLGGVLCVIGDPLQSIYGFRGANAKIFEIFKKDFPQFEEIILDTNYRSDKSIIDASHKLFPQSVLLKSDSSEIGEVKLINTSDEFSEADYVINQISKYVGGTNLNEASDMVDVDQKACFADFAVIYRTHNLARILKQRFEKSGIPFQVVGDGNVYQTKIFDTFYLKLEAAYKSEFLKGGTLSEIAQKLAPKERSTQFNEILNDIVRFDNPSTGSPRGGSPDSVGITRTDSAEPGQAFEEYKKYVEEMKLNEGYDKKADRVSLLTIHASKGLEFKYVFICGFEEGNIPFIKKGQAPSTSRGDSMEPSSGLDPSIDSGLEEKRLLYVAMTRAKNQLTLISAKKRNKQEQKPSRFEAMICKSKYVIKQEDQHAKKIEIRKEKYKQKKSQLKLF